MKINSTICTDIT